MRITSTVKDLRKHAFYTPKKTIKKLSLQLALKNLIEMRCYKSSELVKRRKEHSMEAEVEIENKDNMDKEGGEVY